MKIYNRVKIRRNIMIPLGIALFFLIGSGIFGMYWLYQKHINAKVQMDVKNTSELFQTELNKDAELISAHINSIEKNENLRNAWLGKDRAALLAHTAPLFEHIRSSHRRITHFYFISLDRICFLRVHNPKRYGDKIERFTMLQAERDGKEVHGIELGPFGTFTLRVIRPWHIDGKMVGYIELGEEISHITPEFKKILSTDNYFLVNKNYLTPDKWEEGLTMAGLKGDWDQFPLFVIIDGTMESLPTQLSQYLNSLQSYDAEEYLAFKIEISSGERQFLGGFTSLNDAGGRDVGNIIVLTDITKGKATLQRLIIALTVNGFIIGASLLIFFYVFIGRIEANIITTQNSLMSEVKERKKAEEKVNTINQQLKVNDEQLKTANQQLMVAKTSLEKKVKDRTEELEKEKGSLEIKVQKRTKELTEAKESLEIKVQERTKDLEDKMKRLKMLNDLMTGRELKMTELKKEINTLYEKLGKPKPYSGDVS